MKSYDHLKCLLRASIRAFEADLNYRKLLPVIESDESKEEMLDEIERTFKKLFNYYLEENINDDYTD